MQVDIKSVLKERFGDFARDHLQFADDPFDSYVHVIFKLPIKSLGNAIRVRLLIKKSGYHGFMMTDRYDLYRSLRREFGTSNVHRAIRIARKIFPMTSELTSFCDDHKVTESAFTIDELIYNAVDYFTMAVIIWTLTKGNSFFGMSGVGRKHPLPGPDKTASRLDHASKRFTKAVNKSKATAFKPALEPSMRKGSAVSSSAVSSKVADDTIPKSSSTRSSQSSSASSDSFSSLNSDFSSLHSLESDESSSSVTSSLSSSESRSFSRHVNSVIRSANTKADDSESNESSDASESSVSSSSPSSDEDPLAKYKVPYNHSVSTYSGPQSSHSTVGGGLNLNAVIRSHQDNGHYDGDTVSRPSKLVSEALGYLKPKTGKAIRVQDLQDHFHLSYDQARHLMHQLTARQAVSEPINKQSRKVII